MRYLIDGYNLMHALGVMARRFGPEGLRRTRHRFLNDLADVLGPEESQRCTVVFDATTAPEGFGAEGRHHGLTVIYAVDEEDADTRIEQLIAHHSAPKTLTVISSDHRLRRAATRRKAKTMTADAFASRFSERNRSPDPSRLARPAPPMEPPRPVASSKAEARDWLEVFGDLDADLAELDTKSAAGITDIEIARIRREVEEEFRQGDTPRPRPPKRR